MTEEKWWNAGFEIAEFSLPLIQNLLKFQERNGCFPGILLKNLSKEPEDLEPFRKEWQTILRKIIFSLETMAKDELLNLTKEEEKALQEGLELFGKYFIHLWD